MNKALLAKEKYENAVDEENKNLNEIYSKLLLADTSGTTLENIDMTTLKALIKKEGNPTGTIISVMAMAEKKPDGYLVCDGTWYDVNGEYKNLAAYILEQFGSYDYFKLDGEITQANKFKLPDLRGEFLRGTGTNSHTNQGNGVNVGVHQDATEELRVDFHSSSEYIQMLYNSTDGYLSTINPDSIKLNTLTKYGIVNVTPRTYTFSDNYNYYTSRPTNTSVLYCIKY